VNTGSFQRHFCVDTVPAIRFEWQVGQGARARRGWGVVVGG
jgi:hypothetical protein